MNNPSSRDAPDAPTFAAHFGLDPAPLLAQAYALAKAAHARQRRKFSGAPYLVHPVGAAILLSSAPHTTPMLAAALLHDVLEDTDVSITHLRVWVGDEVAELVSWVSNLPKPGVSRADSHERYVEQLSTAPPAAQSIKLADILDNARDIVTACDPQFAARWLGAKAALLPVLARGDAGLYVQAQNVVDRGLALLQLAKNPPGLSEVRP